MIYLYAFLLIAVAALIYMHIETTLLEVKRLQFTKDKNALKIIQLSDIHIRRLFVSPEKIRQVIEEEKPDFVVMTGDFIEHRRHIPRFMSFLDQIGAKSNFLLCLGNHDYEAFLRNPAGLAEYQRLIKQTGVQILHNKCVCCEKASKVYNIIGIADLRYKHQNVQKAFEGCSEKAFANIGFSHNPDIALEMPKGKLDYLLCGHFHGGQIWAPFDLEFKLLRKEKLCKMGIKSGLHKVNGINLYISRGLGNVSLPLRFLSRPEITIFHIP